MDLASLEKFKLKNTTRIVGGDRIQTTFIPTGVFVQTLESTGPGLTRITGQAWQRLPGNTPRDQRGITFPEATTGEVSLGIEQAEGDGIIQFYPFRIVVREEVNSNRYPFDRTRIIADGVISMEWYFFIMYAAILAAAVNALVFAVADHPVLRYGDNAVAKLTFWPVLLGCFYINSLFFLW